MTRGLVNMSRNLLDAGFKPCRGLLPLRPAICLFVAAKVTFLVCVATLAMLTLVGPLAGDDYFATVHKLAMLDLQVTGVLMPYPGLESLYWWYRLRRGLGTLTLAGQENRCHHSHQILLR